MENTKREGKKVNFWLSNDEYQKLSSLAYEKDLNMSELLRGLIFKQLGIDGANDGLDIIRNMFRDEIKIQLKTQIERLVKIIIKVGLIEVSSFYYEKALLKLTNPALEEELRESARKEAAAYLGVKNNRAVEEVYREFTDNYSLDFDDYDESE